MIFPPLQPVRRYESQPLYLGDLRVRKIWAERKPTIEIEVMRDIEERETVRKRGINGTEWLEHRAKVVGRGRVKRRGVLNRAVGNVIHVGPYVYHMDEILAYREVKE